MNGRDQSIYLFGKLSQYIGADNLFAYMEEIENAGDLISEIESAVKNVDGFKTKKFSNIYDFRFFRLLMYVITRHKKPEIFIETGVMHGLTSSFIIGALQKNKKGKLISVDYPSYFSSGPSNRDGYLETLPPGKEPGWIVSEPKRKQWDLKTGKSVDVLPTLFKEIGLVDIFLHDSEHTYETMSFEMNFIWERLKNGGILLVDNIDTNNSFADFAVQVNRIPLLLPAPDNDVNNTVRFGLIIK